MLATVTLLEGPSLFAPFAAVRVEAECPAGAFSEDDVQRLLREFLLPALLPHLTLPLRDARFETAVAALANAFQDCAGTNDLPVLSERIENSRCRILLGYLDSGAATLALKTALDVTAALFALASGQRIDSTSIKGRIERTVQQMQLRQPDALARSLIRAARRRGISVRPLAPGSRVWLFGLGTRGVHFFEAANHFDAMTGARLARNKFLSNQLVTRLGFPGVRHGIAATPEAATRLAREIGYPLVVKPTAAGKGIGVTAFITHDVDLAIAFAEANRVAPGEVLVERHVAGDDHRIVVIGGKFAWAVRRSPAAVVGDGEHSILDLMQIENRCRAGSPVAEIGPGELTLDAEVHRVLASQGFSPGDVPAAGISVTLRRIANIARGGTLADCTAIVHPEVRDMAEAIARNFHLDVMGLDFMTPDVSKSWREVECAVLEVNATPGFSSDGRAAIILDAKFPGGSDGRIPAVVLVGASPAALAQVVTLCEAVGARVGHTDSASTFMAGRPRMKSPATLPKRVTALVVDTACEAVVIAATAQEIEAHGFPLARCDVALLGAGASIPAPVRRLIADCADTVHGLPGNGIADGEALAAIRAALAKAGFSQ